MPQSIDAHSALLRLQPIEKLPRKAVAMAVCCLSDRIMNPTNDGSLSTYSRTLSKEIQEWHDTPENDPNLPLDDNHPIFHRFSEGYDVDALIRLPSSFGAEKYLVRLRRRQTALALMSMEKLKDGFWDWEIGPMFFVPLSNEEANEFTADVIRRRHSLFGKAPGPNFTATLEEIMALPHDHMLDPDTKQVVPSAIREIFRVAFGVSKTKGRFAREFKIGMRDRDKTLFFLEVRNPENHPMVESKNFAATEPPLRSHFMKWLPFSFQDATAQSEIMPFLVAKEIASGSDLISVDSLPYVMLRPDGSGVALFHEDLTTRFSIGSDRCRLVIVKPGATASPAIGWRNRIGEDVARGQNGSLATIIQTVMGMARSEAGLPDIYGPYVRNPDESVKSETTSGKNAMEKLLGFLATR